VCAAIRRSVAGLGAVQRRVRAASRFSGTPGCVAGAVVHRVSAIVQLLGATALGLGGALVENRERGIQVGLLVVEQRLVFVAGALRIVEHVLGRRATRLREPGQGLAGPLIVVAARSRLAGMDLVV
jgi:hypothetical protein